LAKKIAQTPKYGFVGKIFEAICLASRLANSNCHNKGISQQFCPICL
jgi:hypothetical protein